MSKPPTLPQIELISAAAEGKLWRHNDQDWTTGTHRHLQVTTRVGALHRAGLLVHGEDQHDGWLWRPTATALHEARCELSDYRSRLELMWDAITAAEQRAMAEEATTR